MRYRGKFDWFIISSILLLLVWGLGSVYILRTVRVMPKSNVPQPQKTIKILVRTGGEAEAMQKIIPQYEAETGINVELSEIGRDGYFTALATQLFAGTNAFDIAFVPSTYVAQFSKAKVIVPFEPFIQDPNLTDEKVFDIQDFITTYKYQGKIYALPTDISTHFLYYRSDLIPVPPETWDEVYEQARKFTQAYDPDSPTRWGTVFTGLSPEELPKAFDTILWSYGGDLLGDYEDVYLDSQPSIKAGNYLEQLVKGRVVPPDLLSWGFSETRDALIKGDVAMAVPYLNAAYSELKNNDNKYKDVIKVALVPGIRKSDGSIHRAVFQHGWALAINANSTNQQEAWKFITYATGKRGGAIYARAGGTPARRSILSDPLLQIIRPEFPIVLKSLEFAKNEPPVSFYPLLIQIQNEALTKILTLHSTPSAALTYAADQLRYLGIHDRLSKLTSEGGSR